MHVMHNKNASMLGRIWQRLRNSLVQEVPEEDAVCEFECHKLKCPYGEWATCERRLRGMARRKAARGRGQDDDIGS
jgi:hypothetical protein